VIRCVLSVLCPVTFPVFGAVLLSLASTIRVAAQAAPETPLLSPVQVHLSGASETGFNPTLVALRFDITGAKFAPDPNIVRVTLNNIPVDTANLQLTPNRASIAVTLNVGLNELSFITADNEDNPIYRHAVLWAGECRLTIFTVDENGQPLHGAVVTVKHADAENVIATQTSVNGAVTFANLPAEAVILHASASGNRVASGIVNGSTKSAQLVLKGFNKPSTVNNNDFSQGTAGWETNGAPVFIIPHEEGEFVPLKEIPTGEGYEDAAARFRKPSGR
jgi:hypothetical protein